VTIGSQKKARRDADKIAITKGSWHQRAGGSRGQVKCFPILAAGKWPREEIDVTNTKL
jgi:hypothetical protein